jgi:hypothetical protein
LSKWPYWFYGFEGTLDVFHLSYLTPVEYKEWSGSGTNKISAFLPAFNKHFVLNGYEVHAYGAYVSCPKDAVVVDKAFMKKYPVLLSDGGPPDDLPTSAPQPITTSSISVPSSPLVSPNRDAISVVCPEAKPNVV